VERLAQREIEALLSYLREIYVSSDLGGFANRVVSTLPRILPSESVSYTEIDIQSRKIGDEVSDPPASDYASEAKVFDRYVHEHPLIDHYQRTGKGQAAKISDFLTRSQWRKRALYNEFYKEVRGIEHQMSIAIPTSALTVGVSLGRSGRDFSERDRSLLDLLRPHLAQAHRNAAALTQTQHDANRLRRAVEGSERGTIVLSGKDRIRWCDERARRWVEEYFGPARGADRLPESLVRWVEHQKSLLSGGGSVPPPREPLILKRPGKHLSVRLAADDPEGETNLLILEERRAPVSLDSLRALGLTAREAEVLVHVAHGKANKEIAAILYVSPLTVKKHLDNVYRKFGVKNRTEALSHALGVLNLLESR
jgi:DNA-binding CsgD family transcriptional regulator